MCAGTLVHISRHLGKMSNNNKKRCQLCIHCMLCRVCFHHILDQIFSLWPYYIITVCILPNHSCSISPVSYSSLIIQWVFPAWYYLLYIYLLLYACTHSTVFNACLWFKFIDTRVFIYPRHLELVSPLVKEFWLPWILMSRLEAWSLWIPPVADLRGAVVAWISGRPSRALSFQTPYASLEFSFYKLVSAICTVRTCTSLCILAFVLISDVIFL